MATAKAKAGSGKIKKATGTAKDKPLPGGNINLAVPKAKTASMVNIGGGKTTKKTTGFNLAKRTNNAVKNVKKQYQNYQKKYNANVNAQMKRDVNASNAQYDANARSAALRNAVSQRELQRQMYRNGITGGASETTMMNAANNYANQQGKIASDKVASANTIRSKAAADRASFALSNAQARDTAVQSAKDRVYNKYQNYLKRKDDLRKERKEDKRYRDETRYNRGMDRYNKKTELYQVQAQGYNTVKGYNKAIKKAKKKGNKRLVAYLQQGKRLLKERNYDRRQAKK